MTPTELATDIQSFASRLVAMLTDKPIVKQQILSHAPLKVRVGIRAAGVAPEAIQAALTSAAMREAWLATWPENTHGGCDPQSIALAGDDKHIVFDLTIFSVRLETPEFLTPA